MNHRVQRHARWSGYRALGAGARRAVSASARVAAARPGESFAGTGCLGRRRLAGAQIAPPWPERACRRSTPGRRRSRGCAEGRASAWSSIPSATTRIPSACPRSIVERTSCTSRPSPSLARRRDEGAVQLELADGERAEVGERREARAEVVDRDDNADVVELVHGALAPSNSAIRLVSVISSTSASRGKSWRSSRSRTEPAKPASIRLVAEMFTETASRLSSARARLRIEPGPGRAPSG